MLVVNLTQQEYKTFQRKVAILKENGITPDYTVSGRNKRCVKVIMHSPVDIQKWDAICEGVN